MAATKKNMIVGSVILAGLAVGMSAGAAQAQYVSYYGYGSGYSYYSPVFVAPAPAVVVAPAPVVMPAPVVVTRAPVYYAPRPCYPSVYGHVSYGRSCGYYRPHGYHCGPRPGHSFSIGFGYSRH